MGLLIDSAIISEVEEASKFGWVSGITTNPTLLAKSALPPEETLVKLASLIKGQIFYQLISQDKDSMLKEAKIAHELLGDQLVLKIPANEEGFKAVSALNQKIPCAVTALFSPAQALTAIEAGAQYVIIYYNRSLRLMQDGKSFISKTVQIVKDANKELLAASLKDLDEIISAKLFGIDHLTIPYALIKKMPDDENGISKQAIDEFNRKGTGISLIQK